MAGELVAPFLAACGIHLPGVRLADGHRQVPGCFYRLFARYMGNFQLQILGQALAYEDRPIEKTRRNHAAAHSWEQFEIGAYRSMLGAAEELGMRELQQMCERFVREEQEMANVFFDQLPAITRQYLREYATP